MKPRIPFALVLALPLALLHPRPVHASDPHETVDFEPGPHLLKPEIARELTRLVNLPSVGYNPALLGASNYWGVGAGGAWTFNGPVRGDSLQGWWPVRHPYTLTGGLVLPDATRPWWALDYGNQVNYVLNSGQGGAGRRTFGVIGVWHSDPGSVVQSTVPGSNPVAPDLPVIAGSRSAWCGLRGPGDLTVQDPGTGNYYNADALVNTASNARGSGTDRNFPGYASQWDQMLYHDVNISGAGPTISIKFTYRTALSTGVVDLPATRTGWFDQDPLSTLPGNYIAAGVVDSFMVYAGRPVEPVAGLANDFTASDGNSYDIYDLRRRWFSEVIHTEDNSRVRMFAATGVHAQEVKVVTLSTAILGSLGYGSTLRLVFRVKTNRGWDDDFSSREDPIAGGLRGSGGRGAAIVDDVQIDLGGGYVPIGTFEPGSGPLDIDNSVSVPPTDAWKATGKPPGITPHVHDLAQLVYQDLCGPPGSQERSCNMESSVISAGDHDREEALAGSGLGALADESRIDGILSPTINLVTSGTPSTPNNMGLTLNDIAGSDLGIRYDVYTGGAALPLTGVSWQPFFQSWPAVQFNGSKGWGEFRTPNYMYFDSDPQCFTQIDWAWPSGLIRTSNSSDIPDSVRIGLRKIVQCFRFGLSTNCGTTLGLYWDNISLVFDQYIPHTLSAGTWEWLKDTFPFNEDSGLPGTLGFDSTACLVKSGLNTAQSALSLLRPDIPGDSMVVISPGRASRVDMIFRVNPGPGNYVVHGDPSSGLRKAPSGLPAITQGDGSFWSSYINNNGPYGSPGGHGTVGPWATRWNPLVWNSARCDTAELNLFPVSRRWIGPGPGFELFTDRFATTLHENEARLSELCVPRNRCFVNDTLASPADITCGTPFEPAWPPAWLTTLPAAHTGWNGTLQTCEGTKILPDGIFTPGTHVQYYFRAEDAASGYVSTMPDPDQVYPQWLELSTDGHRWAQFSVLPDFWKKVKYGGTGLACMLAIDANDRRGNERVWSSIADSVGATSAAKFGAHNGWHAPGGSPSVPHSDVNDPFNFVDLNQSPGTLWDLYSVRGAESLEWSSAGIGSRLSYRPPLSKVTGKWDRNGPTRAMLDAYYLTALLATGDINSEGLGPYANNSSDDAGIVHDWLVGGSPFGPRGLWAIGDGLAEEMQGSALLAALGASYTGDYRSLSGDVTGCVDFSELAPLSATTNLFGADNLCWWTNDVLAPLPGGNLAVDHYGAGTLWPAGVLHPVAAGEAWVSLLDGIDLEHLVGRFSGGSFGRLAYAWDVLSSSFSQACVVAGPRSTTLGAGDGLDGTRTPRGLRVLENPSPRGRTSFLLGLSRREAVDLVVFDVSGRRVRALLSGRTLEAGEHRFDWDGRDEAGRPAKSGVYFARVRYAGDGAVISQRTVLLQ